MSTVGSDRLGVAPFPQTASPHDSAHLQLGVSPAIEVEGHQADVTADIVGVEEASQGRSSSSGQALPEIRARRAASTIPVPLRQWKTRNLLTCGTWFRHHINRSD
jgi:hypothetical protein